MKLKLCSFVVLLTIALAHTSCEKNLELPSTTESKIVLLGEIVANESIYLRAGQSTPVKSGTPPAKGLLQNLTLSVTDGSGNVHTLNGAEDDLSSSEYTLAFSSITTPQPGMRYELTAKHDLLGTATAKLTLPKSFNAVIKDTTNVTFNGEQCIRINTQIADEGEKNYYVLEVLQQPYTVEPSFFFNGSWIKVSDNYTTYDSLVNAGAAIQERMDSFYLRTFTRVNFYLEDEASEHVINGKRNQLAKRLLLNDKTFNGNAHVTSIIVPRGSLSQQFPGIGMRTLVQIKSVTEDYFHFLQAYEQMDPFSGIFNTATPSEVPGNVSNGVGIVGGVFKREFIYHF
jgi:hypothetical protein